MEAILNYIITYAPVLIAIISEVGVVAALLSKVTKYFKTAEETVKELKESVEYKQLKNQMKIVLSENAELKRQMTIVMEKLTHVKVQDEQIKNNKKQ